VSGIPAAGWELQMQTVVEGYRGLSLLMKLNFDRIFSVGTIAVGLMAGAFLGSMLIQL
jgi:hypothetical protein